VNVRYGTADRLSQLGVRKEVDREGILRAIEKIESADLQTLRRHARQKHRPYRL